MNYDDEWFWSQYQQDQIPGPENDAAKVMVGIGVLVAIAVIVFYLGVL